MIRTERRLLRPKDPENENKGNVIGNERRLLRPKDPENENKDVGM